MDLSVIIAAYNSWPCLPECLEAIRAHAGDIRWEVIVVDNASSDGTPEKLAVLFPQVCCIVNSANLGFSRGCNQGMRRARGEFFLLLNPDSYLISGTLAAAVSYLRGHPDVGILGARVLNKDGSLQLACRRSIPTLRSAFFRFAGLSRLFPRHRALAAYNLTHIDEMETADVESVSGAFMMTRRSLVDKIGGLDERFFMFGEDLDWCLRVARAGWRVVYWPDVVIRHLKGQSIATRRYASLYHFHHAMWLFYRKHYAAGNGWWKNCAAFGGIWTLGIARVLWEFVRVEALGRKQGS